MLISPSYFTFSKIQNGYFTLIFSFLNFSLKNIISSKCLFYPLFFFPIIKFKMLILPSFFSFFFKFKMFSFFLEFCNAYFTFLFSLFSKSKILPAFPLKHRQHSLTSLGERLCHGRLDLAFLLVDLGPYHQSATPEQLLSSPPPPLPYAAAALSLRCRPSLAPVTH